MATNKNDANALHPIDTTAHVALDTPPEQQNADALVREAFKIAHATLDEHVPDGRYKSLALTAIETAAMWAIKGIFHRK